MSNSRPIIFLDVDGVLNSYTRMSQHAAWIDPENLAVLIEILAETKAQIVLSSAWRLAGGHSRNSQFGRELLLHDGYGEFVLSNTIDSLPPYDYPGAIQLTRHEHEIQARSAGILRYVAKRKLEHWIAIDDLNLDPFIADKHFHQTDSYSGLISDDVGTILRKVGVDRYA